MPGDLLSGALIEVAPGTQGSNPVRSSGESGGSAPIRREYPATSAARMAVRRRTGGMARPAVGCA